jgi:phosphoribosylformylglycinamidine (FGAM) synthase PurS component
MEELYALCRHFEKLEACLIKDALMDIKTHQLPELKLAKNVVLDLSAIKQSLVEHILKILKLVLLVTPNVHQKSLKESSNVKVDTI